MGEVVGLGRTAEVLVWGEGRVVKLFFDWMDDASIEREFFATRQAYQAGIPVPQPYELVVQDGRRGILFERVQGETMLHRFGAQPWRMYGLLQEFADLQAAYLKLSGDGLPSLKQRLARDIQRVMKAGGEAALGELVLRRLQALPENDRLCHMDFHVDNVMHTPRGWVILDWMNACQGDPMADLARSSLMMKIGGPPPGTTNGWLLRIGGFFAHRIYQKAIWARHPLTQAAFEAWLLPVAAARIADNIPGERERLVAIVRRLAGS